MVSHIGHVLHGVILFDVPPLLLVLEEVGEELLLHFGPFHLLEGGDIMPIVNLEDMLKVFPPPSALIISGILQRVFRWGPCTTATLGWSTFRCWSWGNIARCSGGVLTHLARRLLTGRPNRGPLLHSPGVTGRPGVIISASSSLPPMTISILTAHGHGFVNGGVEGDSQPHRLTSRLHHLLVMGCWLTPGIWEGLVDGWCHLRSLWHRSPWCLSLPVQSGCHVCSPPSGRSVPWGSR